MTAASLIRAARAWGRLSQRALAERAGTSGPTVAAYEAGVKDPRGSTLLRLVEAAGMELRLIERRPAADRFRDLLAAATAEKVAADPSLLDRAAEVMDSGLWRSAYQRQWRALISAGPEAVVGVLTSTHPDTLALKADAPFALLKLVDDDQRQELLETAYTT